MWPFEFRYVDRVISKFHLGPFTGPCEKINLSIAFDIPSLTVGVRYLCARMDNCHLRTRTVTEGDSDARISSQSLVTR